jgi:hypothetical protein
MAVVCGNEAPICDGRAHFSPPRIVVYARDMAAPDRARRTFVIVLFAGLAAGSACRHETPVAAPPASPEAIANAPTRRAPRRRRMADRSHRRTLRRTPRRPPAMRPLPIGARSINRFARSR